MPASNPVHAALKPLLESAPAYQVSGQFYDGTISEVIVARRLRALFRDSGKYFRINYARTVVDALQERTLIQGIACEDARGLALLNQCWEDNQLGIEAKRVHRLAYTYGDAYLIAWPDEAVPSGVSIYAHDPTAVRAYYDPQQPRRKTHAVHTWYERFETGLFRRVNLYYPDRVEQWVTTTAITDTAGAALAENVVQSRFEPYVTDDAPEGVVENPYGVVPVFHFRTDWPYGRSELEDAKGPQNAINRAAIMAMVILERLGAPQRIVMTDSALDSVMGNGASAPNPFDLEAVLNGEQRLGLDAQSEMPSGAGEVWKLSGKNVRVQEFAAAQMANFISSKESLIKDLASVSDIPLYYFDRSGLPPSGEGIRAAESALNSKVVDREALFGVTWRELFSFILQIAGIPASAQLVWAPPVVYSDKASWESAQLQLKSGMSLEAVARERGYTSDEVAQWREDNAAAPRAVTDTGVAGI